MSESLNRRSVRRTEPSPRPPAGGNKTPEPDRIDDEPAREKMLRDFHRRLVDFYEVPKACRHNACRRAGRCADAEVACYKELRPLFQEHVFPKLRQAMLARLGGGMAPPEDP